MKTYSVNLPARKINKYLGDNHSLNISRRYDDLVSGSSLRRPGLSQDCILVLDIELFHDSNRLWRKLQRIGFSIEKTINIGNYYVYDSIYIMSYDQYISSYLFGCDDVLYVDTFEKARDYLPDSILKLCTAR